MVNIITIKRKLAVTTACFLMLLLIFPTVAMAATASGVGGNTPAITFFWADETTVASGESVTFSLRTNNATNHVWAMVDGIRIPATLLDNNSQTGQRSWGLSVRPMASQAISIYAGVNNNVGMANVIFPITVHGGASAPTFPNIQPHPMPTPHPIQPAPAIQRIYSIVEIEASVRNAVTLEIVTGNNSRYVWVRFDNGRYRIASLVSEIGSRRVWQVIYTPNVYRRHTVQVSANHAYIITGAVNRNFQVELVAPFVVPVNPLIFNTTARPSNILAGESTTITVNTNADVNYVWAMVDGRRINARRTGTSNSITLANSPLTTQTWVIDVTPAESQSILISASHASSQRADVTRSVNVTVNRELPSIRSASAQWNATGTQIQATIITNRATQWVDLQISGRAGAVTATSRNSGTNEVTWTAIFTPTVGWRYAPINVFAGGAQGVSWGNPTETMAVISHIDGATSYYVPPAISSVGQPIIVPDSDGNFDAVFTVTTTSGVNSVFIRALDTGNFDNANSTSNFSNINQNQRHWTIVLPISGDTAVDFTRFEVEAVGASGVLAGGRYVTGSIQFR